MGLISLRLLILNATNSWHMETLLHEFFVPFNVFLMLSYYTLFLEQNIIVSFDGPVQQYNNNYWKAFLFIIHTKTSSECLYLLYTNVAFSAACGELFYS